jgi:transcription-repair coupling factor (superfamily II helicase)
MGLSRGVVSRPRGPDRLHRQAPGRARVRPDQKVVVMDGWETPEERLKGALEILRALVGIAEKGKKAT